MARRRGRRAWGSGEVYATPSGAWGFRFRFGGKRARRSGFATREDAERVLLKLRADAVMKGTGVEPKNGPLMTLGHYVEGKDGFLNRRELLRPRSAAGDKHRWKKHLAGHFAHLRPDQIDEAVVLSYAEAKRFAGLSGGTLRSHARLLSTILSDLVARKVISANPMRSLSKPTRALMKSEWDPDKTPFIEKLEDVAHVYEGLRSRKEAIAVAFAIGAYAGLRTGEAFSLQWENVDLARRMIVVAETVGGSTTKDKKARHVPILDVLLPILRAWHMKSGRPARGLVVPPLRSDGTAIEPHTVGKHLRAVLRELGLARPGFGLPSPDGAPQKTWYSATRHTFASQWILHGGSIERLSKLLGHYSVTQTMTYAHLSPDSITERERALLDGPLPQLGPQMAHGQQETP